MECGGGGDTVQHVMLPLGALANKPIQLHPVSQLKINCCGMGSEVRRIFFFLRLTASSELSVSSDSIFGDSTSYISKSVSEGKFVSVLNMVLFSYLYSLCNIASQLHM